MAVHRALVLLLVCVVPQLLVEGCWPSKPAGRLMTRCEKERADGPADGVLPMNTFVKQCEADGSYSTVQCGGSRRFCYCAHPETGVIYKETKTRGQPRSCDNYYILREDTRTPCEKQMYSLNPAMLPGGFIKECEADGSFRKQQRDSAGLWYCVNSETGELYGQTGMRSQIDCDEYEARNDAPAVHVARATPCEKQKFSLNPAMLPGGFIKECEADGSFRKEQRDSAGLWYCVNSETGELYGQTGMSSQIDCVEYEAAVHAEADQDELTPCEMQKDSTNPEMLPGGFIKECEADGSFRKAQRDSAGLWYCVNSETGELYGQTGMRSQIDCVEYEAAVHAEANQDELTPCEEQRNSDNPTMLPGGFIKECEADGSFRKAQRDSAGLWYCVNSETGELYGQTGMRSQIDCDEYEAAVHAETDLDELTPCEKQMDSDNPTMLPGGFIKECEADGSFARTQCDSEGLCYCVNTETGVPYPPGRRGPIDCDAYLAMVHTEGDQDERTPCEKQRDSDNPTMLPGGFIKECEADGSFSKLQCDSEGLCYCVNTETGELYGQTGMRGVFDCDEYQAMHDAGENWRSG